MKIIWEVTENDSFKLNEFYTKNKSNPFVLNRIKRNQYRENIIINKEIFWETIVSCLLTSQQRSGPNSAISMFIRENPFPLSLELCQKQNELSSFAEKTISKRKGIRFPTKIGNELEFNLNKLKNTNWEIFTEIINYFNSKENAEQERKLSEKIDDLLKGFGPKQSRNLLQSLGITKFEIPIDSRITKWLNDFGFPIKISANALSDKEYYNFIMDGIITLCKKAKILPCIFDAIIFSSYDSDWNDGNIIY